MVDAASEELDAEFNALCSDHGHDATPPEKLRRARLPMVLYTLRSKCQSLEQIDHNLLFRWFVDFSMDALHVGCRISQTIRKRIEECLGRVKVIVGMRNPGPAACRWPGSRRVVCLGTGESG